MNPCKYIDILLEDAYDRKMSQFEKKFGELPHINKEQIDKMSTAELNQYIGYVAEYINKQFSMNLLSPHSPHDRDANKELTIKKHITDMERYAQALLDSEESRKKR